MGEHAEELRVRSSPAEPLIGRAIWETAAELFPICRSLAGAGNRQTLDIIDREIGLTRTEVPSGAKALDWTVPPEWAVTEAWIRDPAGRVVLDFHDCNLHVVNFSTSIRSSMPLSELRRHIFTLPDQPDVVPYRTSYYNDAWGFCMRHRDFERLLDGIYEVCIASEHTAGHMSYGEHVVPGRSDREFLLSAHICHPSLANDNCSGIAVLTHLAKSLAGRDLYYNYRFLFAPGSIGALTWLSRNEERVHCIDHGLVVSCLGDGGGPTYKCSRRGEADIDRVMRQVLKSGWPHSEVREFAPYGYDERQFCSPGYNLPVGLLQRSSFSEFPEYHNSGDNLEFIRPQYLAESHGILLEAIETIEADWTPVNLSPRGEPQLGRRGLYGSIGGSTGGTDTMALLWVLNLADGWHSLLDIAERSGLAFRQVALAAERLKTAGLLGDAYTRRARAKRRGPLGRKTEEMPGGSA